VNLIKRLVAGLLNVVVLSVLLLGSCAGPGVVYSQSPKWLLEDVGTGKPKDLFFVAFMAQDGDGSAQLNVRPYNIDPASEGFSGVRYEMPKELMTYTWQYGEGNATIDARTEAHGSQLIQIFVAGDTPWTTLSEYRVVDNKVYPLRYASSNSWFLLLIFPCFFLVIRLEKPIRSRVRRLLQIKPE